ncbi:endonuclease [Caudoviricetes sp.]|nr:endonuclease [Caudoviricetes sp.]
MNEIEKKRKNAEYQRNYYHRKKNGIKANNPGRLANTSNVLWSKVDKRGEDECWEWKGFKNEQGYGRTWINDKGYYAHRVIFNLVYPNTITLNAPKSTDDYGFLLHTCDNPPCCNPKHLFVGSHEDNMADKANKGRCPDFSGGKGPRCKLTMSQAREIRQKRQAGISAKKLSEMYQISLASIKTLLRGDSYKE